MKVKRYTLEANAKGAFVYAHFDNGTKSAIEGTRSAKGNGVNPKTLEGLRKHGIKMAKLNDVAFEDEHAIYSHTWNRDGTKRIMVTIPKD